MSGLVPIQHVVPAVVGAFALAGVLSYLQVVVSKIQKLYFFRGLTVFFPIDDYEMGLFMSGVLHLVFGV